MAICLILLLLISNAFADDVVNSGGVFNKGILLTTEDGATSVKAKQIKVSNGTLTNNGDGSASITTGGGSGGWTSGTGKVYLTTSTDNVGIGSSTPNAKLVIKDTGTLPTIAATTNVIISDTSASSDSGTLSLISGDSGYSTINFGDTTSENVGLIQYAHPRNSIDFRANSGIIMSVHGNTNVGIGTIIPTVEAAYRGLEIKAPTNAGATISLDTTDVDRNPQIEFVENNIQKWKLYNENASDSLRARTGGTDVLILTSAGNVGIGTTTPQGGLVINNGNLGVGTVSPKANLQISSSDSYFVLSDSDATSGERNAYLRSSSGRLALGFQNDSFAVTSEAITVKSNGNVGIGTTTPAGALTVMNGNVGIGTWVPNSSIYINGSAAFKMVQTTTTYAVLATDYTVECTSGTFTVTLETAVGATGRIHQIKNSGSGTITIATTSSQTIDGQASGTITLAQYDSITVQSNGSNWIIL